MQRSGFVLALLTATVLGQPALAHDFKSGGIELKDMSRSSTQAANPTV